MVQGVPDDNKKTSETPQDNASDENPLQSAEAESLQHPNHTNPSTDDQPEDHTNTEQETGAPDTESVTVEDNHPASGTNDDASDTSDVKNEEPEPPPVKTVTRQPDNPTTDTDQDAAETAEPEETVHDPQPALAQDDSTTDTEDQPAEDQPPQPKPAGTLHLLSYLLWEREGVSTFEKTRAELLDTVTLLTEHLKANADAIEQLKHVILGGQTVLIEDIADVRSDLVALLAIYNAGGRFGIGPWYIQVDSTLVSGESLIRNLLLGRTDVTRHGVELMDSAFMPSAVEHPAQLPQILTGFDISAVMITSPKKVMSLPFRWVAPDGSHVLVVSHYDSGDISKAIKNQKYTQPDGPFLWLNPIDNDREPVAPDVSDQVQVPVIQSTLGNYVAALRKGLPDGLRPALKGELRLLGPGYRAGRFSTRMYLKQANAGLQSLLTYQTEPWLAIALTDGKLKSPDNLRALLDHSWRELMKNQSRNNLTGCSHDTVTQETEIRNQRIRDVTQRIQDISLDALPGSLTRTTAHADRTATRHETYIGVWNSHSCPMEQVVEVDLILPDGKYPNILLDHNGEEVNFSWESDETDADTSGRIGFRAQVGAVGYSVYTLKLNNKKPKSHHNIITNKGKVIGNVAGETLLVEKGQLVWSRSGQRITDFLTFYDGGDAGDTFNYRKPQPDVVVRAGMTDMVNVQSTATYERLIFRKRMRIAPELKDDLTRTRGLSLLDITTTATFYDNVPGIYFRTTFTNKAKDHRLRAHFRTGMVADHVLTDAPFGLTRRKIVQDSTLTATQPQVNVFPMQMLTAVAGKNETLMLMSRGLTEVEALMDKDEVTLALTLLRSVGWLQRANETSRGIPVKGAQYERDVTVEYAILPLQDANPATMLRAGHAYNAPLQAFQYHEKPDPISHSYLTFESEKALMTTLKPPQTGNGWIVRFVNPTDETVSGKLGTHRQLQSAKLVNLAEEDKAEYTITKNTINVNIEPHKIHTIRLEF